MYAQTHTAQTTHYTYTFRLAVGTIHLHHCSVMFRAGDGIAWWHSMVWRSGLGIYCISYIKSWTPKLNSCDHRSDVLWLLTWPGEAAIHAQSTVVVSLCLWPFILFILILFLYSFIPYSPPFTPLSLIVISCSLSLYDRQELVFVLYLYILLSCFFLGLFDSLFL